ncbi:hypothetical protein ACHAWF_009791 [Thalassiosira exigua]
MSPFEPPVHDAPPAAETSSGDKGPAAASAPAPAPAAPPPASPPDDAGDSAPRPSRRLPQTPGSDSETGMISPLTLLRQRDSQSSSASSTSLRKLLRSASQKVPHPHHHRRERDEGGGKEGGSGRVRDGDRSAPTTPQVDSYCISKIDQAREKVKRSFDGSALLERDERVFPRFDMEELALGEVLGRGGFGTVLEIKAMRSAEKEEEKEEKEDGERIEGKHICSVDQFEREKRHRTHRRFTLAVPHLRQNHSHDGVEGVGRRRARLPSIAEVASFRVSRSHDCVDDERDGGGESPPNGRSRSHDGLEGGGIASDRSEAGTSEGGGGGGGGDRGVRRPRTTRASSWSHRHPKLHAAALDARRTAHDVSSSLFHHHHHHGGPQHREGGADEGGKAHERGDAGGDEEKSERRDDDAGGTAAAEVAPEKGEATKGDPGGMSEGSSRSEKGPTPSSSERRRRERAPSNFSFQAWRDSEAGEEGNDAISEAELAEYDLDGSFFQGGWRESAEVDLEAENAAANVPEDGAEATKREALSESGVRTEVVVEPNLSKHGRRIVLYSGPTQEAPPTDFDEEAETNHSYYPGFHHHQDKAFIVRNVADDRSGDARYVVKIISPHIVESDFRKFLQAAMDMATETYFLSVLRHPNILKMRAVGQGDMFSPSYFLVLDRLYDTLSDRIEGSWTTRRTALENNLLVWNRAPKLRSLWEERMGVMRDLADALAYLHETRVVYRDIKPENVGFDGRGQVKLFDFGLAKEVREEDECANGTYKLTPNTGSIRYMAPENGNRWPYNHLADVYSFGILLWEVAALERPFENYTPREIRDMVMKWGERPKVREEWSERVTMLMKMAWDSNFRKRPTMKAVENALSKEIEDRGGI